MKEETGVKIDSGELLTSLECTVCYSNYVDPTMTKCGHTYCKNCIEACINKNHICPECNTPLTAAADLARNIPIERILRQIKELQEKAKKDPMNAIIGINEKFVMSPIVSIFSANLKECLTKFEAYCEKLKIEVEDVKQRIKSKFAARLAQQSHFHPDPEVVNALKVEEANEIAAVEKQFKGTFDSLIQAYDRYMKDVVPEPKIETIKVVVQVPSKNIRLESVSLKPYDTMKDIKTLIEKTMDVQKNPVAKWGADVTFNIIGPQIGIIPEGNLEEAKGAMVLTDDMKSVMECKIQTGSRIIVKGKITCEGDRAKPCITLKFRKEESKAYDYYSCNTCSLNWVCEPCMQHCHKGHDIKEYLKQHVPQWACCYCTKKGCKLPNKNNPAAILD